MAQLGAAELKANSLLREKSNLEKQLTQIEEDAKRIKALEDGLRCRASLVCSAEAPAPFAPHLLDQVVPTQERIAQAVRQLVLEDVAAWIARLTDSGLAGATVRYVHRVMSLILELAVRDGRMARNPADEPN